MSRIRKAALTAGFSYVQFGLAFVSGILMVPIILSKVGTQSYGLWLACGELLAYSAMVDLGVLNVLPWLIAEKDGRKDRAGIRKLIGYGLAAAVVTALLYVLVALSMWGFSVGVTDLNAADKATLFGPLLLLIAGTAILFPFRTFYAVLNGLQDVFFFGFLGIGQWALNICLILLLLFKGYGLYALAASAVVPPMIGCALCLIRIRLVAPDLLTGWSRPTFSELSYLMKEGFGTWLGNFGWRMIAASNSAILVAIRGPEMAVIYACTAKMGEILMQIAWQLPDSGMVGLAQLSGEGNRERVREVVLSMLRLLLVTTGGVACAVLLLNPGFVTLWVGADKFGGLALNALLAAIVIGHSLTHGLVVPASVLGSRLQAGLLTIVQGGLFVSAALLLGRLFGATGVAAASLTGSLVFMVPLAALILKRRTGLTFKQIWGAAIMPWFVRAVTLMLAAGAAGAWVASNNLWIAGMFAPPLAALYLWSMRPLYVGLPLPLRFRPWLVKLRLLPQEESPRVVESL